MKDVFINGFGAFLPGEPVSNREMESYLGFVGDKPSRYRALVLRQNKIKTRHYALSKEGQPVHSNSEMSALAVRDAVKKSEIMLTDLTYLATATTLGDLLLPGLASHVHADLGLPPIEIASFQSVCASAMMAIKTTYLQVGSGEHRCAAVAGSEFVSRYLRPGFYEHTSVFKEKGELALESDFLRFTLSDGAGSLILENRPNERQLSFKIRWIDIRSFADRFETCMVAGGTSNGEKMRFWGDYAHPIEAVHAGALTLYQDFELMKKMIPVWISHYLDLIHQKKIVISEIDHVCSHYSSNSLREETVHLLKKSGVMIDENKWFSNLCQKGNTGSAAIFIMLEEFYSKKNLRKGQTILCHVPESGRALNAFMLLEVV